MRSEITLTEEESFKLPELNRKEFDVLEKYIGAILTNNENPQRAVSEQVNISVQEVESLLRKPLVINYIENRLQSSDKKLDGILHYLQDIIYSDIRDILETDFDGLTKVKDLTRIPASAMRGIKSLNIKRIKGRNPDDPPIESVTIDTIDKLKAMELYISIVKAPRPINNLTVINDNRKVTNKTLFDATNS
jgi:hypothetical protein